MNDHQLHHLFNEWADWRRFYRRQARAFGPKLPKSAIGQLLPSSYQGEDLGENQFDASLVVLDQAILAQEEDNATLALFAYYLGNVKRERIKELARKMQLTYRGFHKCLQRGRKRAFKSYVKLRSEYLNDDLLKAA